MNLKDRIILTILTMVILIVIILITVGFNQINNQNPTSKYDLQCIYYPTINSTININDLGIEDHSIANITNETFTITIYSKTANKSITYNLRLEGNNLSVEFDETYMNPRLNLGYIDENKNYSLEFIFNIVSDDLNIKNLNVWGDSNHITANISYNHIDGLNFSYAEDYSGVYCRYSNHADIILTFPHDINFGIYLGILAD